MGNSTSNAANTNLNHSQSPRRYDSPTSRNHSPVSRGGSPSRVHKSLRSKKRSLELPDLASLTLTPATNSPNSSPHAAHRRPRASSPIPIPIPISAAANQQQAGFRLQNNLPSAAHLQFAQSARAQRYKSYLSSAYPSTQSFTAPDPEQNSPPREEPPRHEFVPELVVSTIPLALPKAEGDVQKPEHVPVTIRWRGGGRSVVLARAGDDYWKGRQTMEYDSETKTWSTQIHVLPGTHHFRFIVDDQWKIADDYPTAVDDIEGSLANYVNASSGATVSPQSSSPQPTPLPNQTANFGSFWTDASTSVVQPNDLQWTTEIPQELVNAAAEEEHYLASADSPTSSSSVPAPNVPPAPVLPRHLDKLILNVRPQIAAAPGSPAERERRRDKEKDRSRRRERERDSRARNHGPSMLGMTSTAADDPSSPAASAPPTPSEENTQSPTATPSKKAAKLDIPGMADDGSVLPVPSHVVLHHLSTSAIRSGVLAVANTTRYRKKYITTIYYKPT